VQHGDHPAVEVDIGSIQADGFTDPHPSAGQQPDQCLVGDRLNLDYSRDSGMRLPVSA
jgi:hypothetical protein